MTRQTAHIMDRVLPDVPLRQWVLSLPFELRPMVSLDRELQNKVLKIFVEEVFRHYGADPPSGLQAGAISFTQRFGGALNLHVHFHVLALDGLYVREEGDALQFEPALEPSSHDVRDVAHRVHDRFMAYLLRAGRIASDHVV
ncbi:MAG: transposase, partial [Myxococcota bacterium]